MTRPDNRHLARIIVGLTRSGYAEDQINSIEELLNKYFPVTEDKKAPVDEDVNNILSKHIKYFDSWPHLHSLCKSDVLNAYNAIPKAMQEYASQERNRAIQECIDLMSKEVSFGYIEYQWHALKERLENLKK